jgi:hypothetical protein
METISKKVLTQEEKNDLGKEEILRRLNLPHGNPQKLIEKKDTGKTGPDNIEERFLRVVHRMAKETNTDIKKITKRVNKIIDEIVRNRQKTVHEAQHIFVNEYESGHQSLPLPINLPAARGRSDGSGRGGSDRSPLPGVDEDGGEVSPVAAWSRGGSGGAWGGWGSRGNSGEDWVDSQSVAESHVDNEEYPAPSVAATDTSNTPSVFFGDRETKRTIANREAIQTLLEPDPSNKVNAILANAAAQIQLSRVDVKRAMEHRGFQPGAEQSLADDASSKLVQRLQDLSWVRTYYALDLFRHWMDFNDDGLNLRLPAYIPEERAKSCLLNLTYAGDGTEELSLHCEVPQQFLHRGKNTLEPQNEQHLHRVLELLHDRLRQHLDFVWGLKEARVARALEVGTQPRKPDVQAECAKDTQYCALAIVVWALEDAIAHARRNIESQMKTEQRGGLGVKVRTGGEFPPTVHESDVCLGVQTQEAYTLQLFDFVKTNETPERFLQWYRQLLGSELTLEYTHPVKRPMGIQYDQQTKPTIDFVNFLQKKSQGEYSLLLKLDTREYRVNFTEYGGYGHTWTNALGLRIGQTYIKGNKTNFEFRNKSNWEHYKTQNESSMTFTGKVNEIDCMVQAVRNLHWQLKHDEIEEKLESTIEMVNGWFERLQNGEEGAAADIMQWSRAFYTTDNPDVRDLCSYGDRAAYFLYLRTDTGAYVSAVRTFTKSFPRSGKDGKPKPPKRVEDYTAAEAARNRPAPQRYHAPRPQHTPPQAAPADPGEGFERARQFNQAQGRRPPGGGRAAGGGNFGVNVQGIFDALADRMARMEENLTRFVQAQQQQQQAAFQAQPQHHQPYAAGPSSFAEESAVARIERMVAEALNIKAREDREAERKAQEQARKEADRRKVLRMPEEEQTEQQAAWGYGVDAADFSTAPEGLALQRNNGKTMQFKLDTDRAEDEGVLLYEWNGGPGDYTALYAVWTYEDGAVQRTWRWTMYTTLQGGDIFQKASQAHRLMHSGERAASEKWISHTGSKTVRITVSKDGQDIRRHASALAQSTMAYISSVDSRGRVKMVTESHRAPLHEPPVYGPFQERYHLRMYQEFSRLPRHTDYLGVVPGSVRVMLRPTLRAFSVSDQGEQLISTQRLDRIELVFRCIDSVRPVYQCSHENNTHYLKPFYHDGALTWGWALKRSGEDEYFIARLKASKDVRFPEYGGAPRVVPLSQALVDEFSAEMIFRYDINGSNMVIRTSTGKTELDYVMTVEQDPDAEMLRRVTEGDAAFSDPLANKCMGNGLVLPFKAEFWSGRMKDELGFMLELQNHYEGRLRVTTKERAGNGRGMVTKVAYQPQDRAYKPQFYMKVYDQATLNKNTDTRLFNKETQKMGDYNAPQFIWIDHPYLNGYQTNTPAPLDDTRLMMVDNHGPVYVSMSGRFMMCPDAVMDQNAEGEDIARFRWALYVWVPAEGRYDLIMRKESADSRTLMNRAAPGMALERHGNAWNAYRQFTTNEKIPQEQLATYKGQKLDVSVQFEQLRKESVGRGLRDNNPFKLVKRFPDHLKFISEPATETRKEPKLTWDGARVVPSYSRVTAPWTQGMDKFCSVLERHIPTELAYEQSRGRAESAVEHRDTEAAVREQAALANRNSKDKVEHAVMKWRDEQDLKLFATIIAELNTNKEALRDQPSNGNWQNRAVKAFVDARDMVLEGRDQFSQAKITDKNRAEFNNFKNRITAVPSCVKFTMPIMNSIDSPPSVLNQAEKRTIDCSVHLVLHNPYTMEYYNSRLGLYLRPDEVPTEGMLIYVWRLYQFTPLQETDPRPFPDTNQMYLLATKVVNPSNLLSMSNHNIRNDLHWRLNGTYTLWSQRDLSSHILNQPVQTKIYYKNLVSTYYEIRRPGVSVPNRIERDATFKANLDLKTILLPKTIMDSYITMYELGGTTGYEGVLYDYSKDVNCLNLWSTLSVCWNPVLFFECPTKVDVRLGNFTFYMGLQDPGTGSKISFQTNFIERNRRDDSFFRQYNLTIYLESQDNNWALCVYDSATDTSYKVLKRSMHLIHNDSIRTDTDANKQDMSCDWDWDQAAVAALEESKGFNIKVAVHSQGDANLADSDSEVDELDSDNRGTDFDGMVSRTRPDEYKAENEIPVYVECEWTSAFQKVKAQLAPFFDNYQQAAAVPPAVLNAPVMTFAKWEPPRLGARW